MDYNLPTMQTSEQTKRLRRILIGITLLTIPCYCIGGIAIMLAPDSSLAATATAVPSVTPISTSTEPLQIPTSDPDVITATLTDIPTATPSHTNTPTATLTHTVTNTATLFQPPSHTPSNTPSITPSLTPSTTFTVTNTFTPTNTQTPSITPFPSSTPTTPGP